VATTLDKPAGLPVFPPHSDPAGDCLLTHLLERQPWRCRIPWPAGFEGGIAHRLDNSTSGAILVADDLEELARIREYFREHRFSKDYLLLAARDVPWDSHECLRPIAHDPRRKNRVVVQRGRNTPHRGKWYPAQTRFVRVGGRLWRATMRSGVMHQIRVHAAFLGIPILGDRTYGGGAAPADLPGPGFYLHHVGLRADDGLETQRVPDPYWSQSPRPPRSEEGTTHEQRRPDRTMGRFP
jgi:23S rRNA pseudouridine1911/1915/1917 synthase